jgi:hypothetical protein
MKQLLDTPVIVHDAVSLQYQQEIEQRFMKQNTLPWYFTYETTQEYGEVETSSVMFHMFQYKKWGDSVSPHFDFIKPLLYELIDRSGVGFREFLQVRAITQFPVKLKRTHNLIHTDLEDPEPYCTGVYYITENVDGDTVLFDKTYYDVPPEQVVSNYKDFKEIQRVNPRRGSAVMFPGCRYHASTIPTIRTRAVINFSWR